MRDTDERRGRALSDRRRGRRWFGFAEKREILRDEYERGSLPAGEYERRRAELEAAEALCERFLAELSDPQSMGSAERYERMREELARLDRDMRYAVLSKAQGTSPGGAAPLLEACFGSDDQWDEDLVDLAAEEAAPEAAERLIRWLERTQSKHVKKHIKKTLHSLRSKGIQVPSIDGLTDRRPVWRPPPAPESYGFMSLVDSRGGRAVWLFSPRRPRGYILVYAMTHEKQGLIGLDAVEFTSRQVREYRQEIEQKANLWAVETDPAYCAFLIKEAYERTPEAEGTLIETYRAVEPLVENLLPSSPPASPVHAVLSAEETGEDSLGETKTLLEHALFTGWRLDDDLVAPFASELEEIQESRIIVSPLQKKERIDSFYRQATSQLFSAESVRSLWRRRLEENAWVLYQKGLRREANLAVRVARLLSEETGDAARSAFLKELVRKSIDEYLEARKEQEASQPSLIVKP